MSRVEPPRPPPPGPRPPPTTPGRPAAAFSRGRGRPPPAGMGLAPDVPPIGKGLGLPVLLKEAAGHCFL